MSKNKIALFLGLVAFTGVSLPALAQDDSLNTEFSASAEFDGLEASIEDGINVERGDGRGPGRGPDWRGPRGPRDPRPEAITCAARNRRGETFRARGFGNPRRIQAQAVRRCEQVSRFRCQPLGCRR